MSALTGKHLCHKKYGDGVISGEPFVENGSAKIRVKFGEEEKLFGYPESIGKFLDTDDPELKDQAASDAAAKMAAEEKRKKDEIEAKEKILEDIKKGIEPDIKFPGNASRIFIVHQGITYPEERKGGYLWAPQSGVFHHENMRKVHAGDIIFHYAEKGIVAVSEALRDWFTAKQPIALYGHGWDNEGYEVIARYQELDPALDRAPLKSALIAKRAGKYSSIDNNGDANQGYLYELELDIAKLFKTEILKGHPSSGVIYVMNRIP